MHGFTRLLLGRLIGLLLVLLFVSLFVFLATELLPGDLALYMLGEKATEEQLEAMREKLGQNDPVHVRYSRWLGNALTGDLGVSRQGRPVVRDIAERFPATMELTLAGALVAITLGLAGGSLAALRRGRWPDRAAMLLALVGVSVPVFWLGLELLQLFAVHWPVLPLTGRTPVGATVSPVTGLFLIDSLLSGRGSLFAEAARHLLLPALTLGIVSSSLLARITRTCLLEEFAADHHLVARARGLGSVRLYFRALRGALPPMVTVMGLEFGALLGGAVITETIFAWPGMGAYLINAILARDIQAVQGAVMVGAAVFVLVNFMADLVHAMLDPRVRHG